MQETIAHILLKTKAVELSPLKPFTFSSGIKSPIYCDNRRLLGFPQERGIIIDAFSEKLQEKGYTTIVGTATAGIAWSAWVAEKMGLPMAYVRSSAKKHGKNKQIEGVVEQGAKVALFEDLISTGGSVYTAFKALQEEGIRTVDIYAIFTYEMLASQELLRDISVVTLVQFSTLLACAKEGGYISEEEFRIAQEWQKNPEEYFSNQQ